jgi:hypothetical protein
MAACKGTIAHAAGNERELPHPRKIFSLAAENNLTKAHPVRAPFAILRVKAEFLRM